MGKVASIRVLVLPAGTFKLSGVITESGGGSLAGVTVAVVSGAGESLQTTSDGRGVYALYGVAGEVRLVGRLGRVHLQIHEVVVTGNDASDSFALVPVETPVNVSGLWTMTVRSSTGCRAGLPDIAQGRSYQVEMIQEGTGLQARISSPTTKVFSSQNPGSIAGPRMRLLVVATLLW